MSTKSFRTSSERAKAITSVTSSTARPIETWPAGRKTAYPFCTSKFLCLYISARAAPFGLLNYIQFYIAKAVPKSPPRNSQAPNSPNAQKHGKAQICGPSHARIPVTLDDFLYPLCGIRHPCCRICQLYESFHPLPYGNDDHTASRNHCRVYQKAKEYECFHDKLNILNVSLHSSVSSGWNRPKNPQNGCFF